MMILKNMKTKKITKEVKTDREKKRQTIHRQVPTS